MVFAQNGFRSSSSRSILQHNVHVHVEQELKRSPLQHSHSFSSTDAPSKRGLLNHPHIKISNSPCHSDFAFGGSHCSTHALSTACSETPLWKSPSFTGSNCSDNTLFDSEIDGFDSAESCTSTASSSPTSRSPSPCAGQEGSLDDHLKLRAKDTRHKTELCRNWEEKRICPYGIKCLFAHGVDELRNVKRNVLFKTSPCYWYYRIGICYHGPRCVFAHRPPFFDDTRPEATEAELEKAHRLPCFRFVTQEAQRAAQSEEMARQRQWFRFYLDQ
mmetsp:Transcript_19933/g.34297  ORF Transcript_19933/g.34297 Transcript_19933/m.34297 type:complete len:273 (-) Transcript_19933:493-1311(-)